MDNSRLLCRSIERDETSMTEILMVSDVFVNLTHVQWIDGTDHESNQVSVYFLNREKPVVFLDDDARNLIDMLIQLSMVYADIRE